MKAVILTSKNGSRLKPVTDDKPKTLVQVNGTPLLRYILDSFKDIDVKEFIVCTGFKSEVIRKYCRSNFPDYNFRFIVNTDYLNTSNMYDLYLAQEYLDDDLILISADIIFEKSIINSMSEEECSCIAVDKSIYSDEFMKVIVKNRRVLSIAKEISNRDSYGCAIGVFKILKNDGCKILKAMNRILDKRTTNILSLEEILNKLYQNKELNVQPYDINTAKWHIINDFDDLAKAEVLFNGKIAQLNKKKVFFLDRDGTLSLGNTAIKYAKEFIDALQTKKKSFYIITNNSSKTPKEHYDSLISQGFSIKEENVLTSIEATMDYLKRKGFKEIFWAANVTVSGYIRENGFILNKKEPQAVLLTYDNEINYGKIVDICRLVRMDIPYFATHCDIVCPNENGAMPDIGTIIKMIEMTTGIVPKKIFGKPSNNILEKIIKEFEYKLEDCIIVGDRIYTDIVLAKNAGIDSMLVLTGETNRAAYEVSNIKADIVIDNLNDIMGYI